MRSFILQSFAARRRKRPSQAKSSLCRLRRDALILLFTVFAIVIHHLFLSGSTVHQPLHRPHSGKSRLVRGRICTCRPPAPTSCHSACRPPNPPPPAPVIHSPPPPPLDDSSSPPPPTKSTAIANDDSRVVWPRTAWRVRLLINATTAATQLQHATVAPTGIIAGDAGHHRRAFADLASLLPPMGAPSTWQPSMLCAGARVSGVLL